MTRKLKVLGLATIATLAMGVSFVSTAQSQVLVANWYPTTVTGHTVTGDIYIDGSTLACTEHWEGTMIEPIQVVLLDFYFAECIAFGFASATANTNGCDLGVHANGEVDIECPSGKAIVITAGNCEVQIGTQTGLKSMSLTNNGTHINAKANVTGITANVTKDGFLCPLNGTGHKKASYAHEGAVTVKPISGGTDISVE